MVDAARAGLAVVCGVEPAGRSTLGGACRGDQPSLVACPAPTHLVRGARTPQSSPGCSGLAGLCAGRSVAVERLESVVSSAARAGWRDASTCSVPDLGPWRNPAFSRPTVLDRCRRERVSRGSCPWRIVALVWRRWSGGLAGVSGLVLMDAVRQR